MMLEYAVNDAGILESNLRDIHAEEQEFRWENGSDAEATFLDLDISR